MSSFHTKPIYPKQQNIGTVLWATVYLEMHSIEQSVINKNESKDNIMWKEVSHDEAMLKKKKEEVREKYGTWEKIITPRGRLLHAERGPGLRQWLVLTVLPSFR